MGTYNLSELRKKINDCKEFVSIESNILTVMFWLCSMLTYKAAIISGSMIVNRSITVSVFGTESVFRYRNSYAHNECVDLLIQQAVDVITDRTDDMFSDETIEVRDAWDRAIEWAESRFTV